jgi:outer membrane protein assembly factor BamB
MAVAACVLAVPMSSFAEVESDAAGVALTTNRVGPMTWPCWRGDGSGTTTDTGLKLVEDPRRVRKVWTSEIQNIPYTWPALGGSGFSGEFICGGYGSPVVCSGRVYMVWWEPSGGVIDSNALYKAQDKRPEKWQVAADEVIACLDATNGKTLWVARMAGTGWNNQYGNHFSIYQPVIDEDVVCLSGDAGIVYCVEVATGKKRWQARLGKITDQIDQWKAKGCILGGKHVPGNIKNTLPQVGGEMLNVSPAIADGVVACNDQSGQDHGMGNATHGLVGFDIQTGKELWRVPNCQPVLGSPIVWNHPSAGSGQVGKRYFIAAGQRVVCVEPRTGKVMWELPLPPDTPLDGDEKPWTGKRTNPNGPRQWVRMSTPALAGDILVLPCNREAGADRSTETWHTGMSAWRLSLDGATNLWSKSRKAFTSTHAAAVIHRGRLYTHDNCLDLLTGKQIGAAPSGPEGGLISSVAGDGHLFRMSGMCILNEDGTGKSVGLKVSTEWYTHCFYASGFLFTRGLIDGVQRNPKSQGAVHCYDLRVE